MSPIIPICIYEYLFSNITYHSYRYLLYASVMSFMHGNGGSSVERLQICMYVSVTASYPSINPEHGVDARHLRGKVFVHHRRIGLFFSVAVQNEDTIPKGEGCSRSKCLKVTRACTPVLVMVYRILVRLQKKKKQMKRRLSL